MRLNPFDEIGRPKVAYTVPEILEPAQFKTLLETAEEEVPELIPFLAMAGFAGVRRSELVREYTEDPVLKWEQGPPVNRRRSTAWFRCRYSTSSDKRRPRCRRMWLPTRLFAQLQKGYPERPDDKGGKAACDTWDNALLHTWTIIEVEQVPMRLEMKRMAPGATNTWFLEVLGTNGGVRFSTAELLFSAMPQHKCNGPKIERAQQ